ncbi:hypothetical protein CCH79_00018667 [Gambusia affinis]|uniref:Uncharacterized protein n=1 Tax=Gambusia affinis TaxID=33528 RepID=A0A315VBH8_GAMAF|nr:hypothetical protein CCH79_00018667 [Gambusia affinis]
MMEICSSKFQSFCWMHIKSGPWLNGDTSVLMAVKGCFWLRTAGAEGKFSTNCLGPERSLLVGSHPPSVSLLSPPLPSRSLSSPSSPFVSPPPVVKQSKRTIGIKWTVARNSHSPCPTLLIGMA